MSKKYSLTTSKARTKSSYDIISNFAKETIEIKLTSEECEALEDCIKALKEIQPVVYEFKEKKLKRFSLI